MSDIKSLMRELFCFPPMKPGEKPVPAVHLVVQHNGHWKLTDNVQCELELLTY